MRKKHVWISCVAALAGVVLASRDADAEPRRQNDLYVQPAVRYRRLLVKNRFEVTPLFESSINADFNHIVGGGLKLEYHLSDRWSIGAVGVFSTAFHTKTVDRIVDTLDNKDRAMGDTSRAPTQKEFLQHLNTMPLHGAAYIGLTPWYGKLAAFSQAYVAFDFYFQAGVSFAQLDSTCDPKVCFDTHPGMSTTDGMGNPTPPLLNPNLDPPLNNGSRLGLYLGGGIHVFLNDFLALDMTVRDYAFSDNPSGADYNADLFVSDKDSRFLHHLFFGAGLSIMFPTVVKRTP